MLSRFGILEIVIQRDKYYVTVIIHRSKMEVERKDVTAASGVKHRFSPSARLLIQEC